MDKTPELDQLREIRDRLGEHGDLFMRLNGFYRIGPDGPVEPEFGYRDMRKIGFRQPIQHEAAQAMADLAPASAGEPVTLIYTNYRGEAAERTITPKRIWFGATEWHPEPQWLVTAFDAEKQADRNFALKDFGQRASAWRPIETAPKDGTSIIAATNEYDEPLVLNWRRGGPGSDALEAWRDGEGDSYINVTDWMPLPTAPGTPLLQPEARKDARLAQLRAQHAAWSQAQFGDVSAVGPAKHLAKEALEVAAAPTDAIEHADCWMLLWDMQRRGGISDAQLVDAIGQKLAINICRDWTATQEGEAIEHERVGLAEHNAAEQNWGTGERQARRIAAEILASGKKESDNDH